MFKLARFLSRALPFLVVVAMMPPPAPAAAWASTPSLDGESFSGTATLDTSNCATGTLAFSNATGSASGPYSGSFTESGTITFTALVSVTDFMANFTLTSPTGSVLPGDGAKFGSLTSVFGVCFVETGTLGPITSNYTAIITLPTGEKFCDTGGTAQTTITVSALGAVTFTEQFSNPSNTTLTTHPPC